MKQRIALIGAGPAGLATAWAVRDEPVEAIFFEKSRGVSGRATTRRRHGAAYDHGANYFKTTHPAVHHLVHTALPTADLVRIERPVWTFDGGGTLRPGDPAHEAAPKWNYRGGINTLGKLLAASLPFEVRAQVRVERLAQTPAGWQLTSAEGDDLGLFDAVVLTPPAPQTRDLLAAGHLDDALQARLLAATGAVSYRAQLAFMLAFAPSLERPHPFYALVATDAAHPVAWLGFEDDKPGHVPAGESLLVVQMAPGWSKKHYDTPPKHLLPEVVRAVESLLGAPLPSPRWTDHQRWRYALPNGAADAEALAAGAAVGLFFAGDWVAGEGRVAAALQSGLDTGARLNRWLSARR